MFRTFLIPSAIYGLIYLSLEVCRGDLFASTTLRFQGVVGVVVMPDLNPLGNHDAYPFGTIIIEGDY
jgi:hypothetical protein